MPIKKVKNAYKNRRKLTYKELEWDYLPMIVLFAVVAGVLTLLLILLSVYQDVRGVDETNRIREFRFIDNFLNRVERDANDFDDSIIEESEIDPAEGDESNMDIPEE